MKIPLTLFSLFLAGKFQFTLIKRREKQLPSKTIKQKSTVSKEKSGLEVKWIFQPMGMHSVVWVYFYKTSAHLL